MIGLSLAYVMMVIFLVAHVEIKQLEHHEVLLLWVASSVVATSFGFHIVIPTLTTYLKKRC